ncbi:hypothetical protein G7084_00170 [Weissella coleopterorum]|uniref:YopX protein domain-containing protein n=1 Tax=Weissella coleopterorum TaxID=2714949 RepID=A0A6G8AY43_9LACO|nr:YopX family protein [Weissella coleopterorum]QIL49875.1 hypothetical protein G7084_00170 [Weissella coleopterorum]
MREIKFRAWDEQTKKHWAIDRWHVGDEYIDLIPVGVSVSDPNIERIWRHTRDLILEQYTGVKDVNDNPVYEGDVVQEVWFTEIPDGSINTTKIGDPFEVKVGNYVYGKWIAEEILNQGFGVTNYVMPDELIILGNIHENPELLEGE